MTPDSTPDETAGRHPAATETVAENIQRTLEAILDWAKGKGKTIEEVMDEWEAKGANR